MRSSDDSTTTFSRHFSLQELEKDLLIILLQEGEASTLEIKIAQGIDCSIKESLVSFVMLSIYNLSSSCSLLSN